jgi:hypothetical protein
VEALQEQIEKDKEMQIEEDYGEESQMNEEKTSLLLPEYWDCSKHDKNLLIAVSDNGIDYLKNMSGNKDYDFEDIDFPSEVLFKRIEDVCEFFKGF